jgi:hypothetical protein
MAGFSLATPPLHPCGWTPHPHLWNLAPARARDVVPARFAPAASLPGAASIRPFDSKVRRNRRGATACCLERVPFFVVSFRSFPRASGLGAVVLKARLRQGARKAGPSQAPPPPL